MNQNIVDDLKTFDWQTIIEYGNSLDDLNDSQWRFIKGLAVELATEQCSDGNLIYVGARHKDFDWPKHNITAELKSQLSTGMYNKKGRLKKNYSIKLNNSHGTNKQVTIDPADVADVIIVVRDDGAFAIDQATAIEDPIERNKAAKYIIQVMGSLNPHLRDVLDFQHKLWDQLFIMSDFKLDVESPYPIPTREVLQLKPDVLNYPQNFPKYRFYGNNIKYMIDVANKWEEGEMKSALVKVIANHMKKCYLSWNKDTVKDDVIFEHLYELSGGKINMLQSTEVLLNTSDLMRTNKKVSNKTNPSGPIIKPKISKTGKSNNQNHKNKIRKPL